MNNRSSRKKLRKAVFQAFGAKYHGGLFSQTSTKAPDDNQRSAMAEIEIREAFASVGAIYDPKVVSGAKEPDEKQLKALNLVR